MKKVLLTLVLCVSAAASAQKTSVNELLSGVLAQVGVAPKGKDFSQKADI